MKDLPRDMTKSQVPSLGQRPAETTVPRRVNWLRPLAGLPIPVLLATMAVLRATELPGSYESPYLLMTLNLVFSTLVSGFIACLIGRSFLVRGVPGLLMLGCGAIFWGTAGLVGIVASHFNINVFVTIQDIYVWLAALCHLAGAVLALRPSRTLHDAGRWLAWGYWAVLGCVGWGTLSVLAVWPPNLLRPEPGGNAIAVSMAIAMFVLAAVLLTWASRRPWSAFLYWYILSLGLIAVGLFGIMLESVPGGPLGWTGRAGQFLGGVYMLMAAIASARESGVRWIPLGKAKGEAAALRQNEEQARREAEQRLFTGRSRPASTVSKTDARALLHELQVYQIELEMQNEELQRAQAAAEEASRKYGDLFDFAPVAYFVWDHRGRIVEVNLAGAALLGLDRNAVIHKRFGQFVATEDLARFADFCARVLATDTKLTCEVKVLKGGEMVHALVEGIASQAREGQERLCRAAVIGIG